MFWVWVLLKIICVRGLDPYFQSRSTHTQTQTQTQTQTLKNRMGARRIWVYSHRCTQNLSVFTCNVVHHFWHTALELMSGFSCHHAPKHPWIHAFLLLEFSINVCLVIVCRFYERCVHCPCMHVCIYIYTCGTRKNGKMRSMLMYVHFLCMYACIHVYTYMHNGRHGGGTARCDLCSCMFICHVCMHAYTYIHA